MLPVSSASCACAPALLCTDTCLRRDEAGRERLRDRDRDRDCACGAVTSKLLVAALSARVDGLSKMVIRGGGGGGFKLEKPPRATFSRMQSGSHLLDRLRSGERGRGGESATGTFDVELGLRGISPVLVKCVRLLYLRVRSLSTVHPNSFFKTTNRKIFECDFFFLLLRRVCGGNPALPKSFLPMLFALLLAGGLLRGGSVLGGSGGGSGLLLLLH